MSNSLNIRSARRRFQDSRRGGYSENISTPRMININTFSTPVYSHYDRRLDQHIAITASGEELAFTSLKDGETGSLEIGDRILYAQGFGR